MAANKYGENSIHVLNYCSGAIVESGNTEQTSITTNNSATPISFDLQLTSPVKFPIKEVIVDTTETQPNINDEDMSPCDNSSDSETDNEDYFQTIKRKIEQRSR
ncbi:hypothetical protein AVEN_11270-1 [Araneus ventricosus]|uniref:Uncharacterized protein n=1 Tax=Araneus ventricosus TaxID=182803 RepID=A0A4Y2GN34_ARAVE|nr:hypothetical protein AVEN_11270-1 [Araneus ventricosus]